jgi:branched-chain amino acid transport system substrate-binding protein
MTNQSSNRRPISRRDFIKYGTAIGTGVALSGIASISPSRLPRANAQTGAGQPPVKIGLVAAITGSSALSGESITRGLEVALEEINANGGVLGGRPLELVIRDDESEPAKGIAASRQLIEQEDVAVIFGGLDSPVSLAMLPVIHELETPYMGVWAAATTITANDNDPNYAFRVSANDRLVDLFMLQRASRFHKASKVGSILIDNPWGESNQLGLEEWSDKLGIEIVGIETFNETDTDISAQLARLQRANAEALILVANAAPGAQMMKSLTRLNWDVPVVSHWGISGGRFPELAGEVSDRVEFVQTYSFYGDQSPVGKKVMAALDRKYGLKEPSQILAPVGVANAYDAMNLVALAIDTAGTTEGPTLREAFYKLPKYEGLIKTYSSPFSPDNHDALDEKDYLWVRWQDGAIVPISS